MCWEILTHDNIFTSGVTAVQLQFQIDNRRSRGEVSVSKMWSAPHLLSPNTQIFTTHNFSLDLCHCDSFILGLGIWEN